MPMSTPTSFAGGAGGGEGGGCTRLLDGRDYVLFSVATFLTFPRVSARSTRGGGSKRQCSEDAGAKDTLPAPVS